MPRIPIQNFYMQTAENLAELSYAEKKKVGCIIVKDDSIISLGYNGTPKGQSNVCEHKVVNNANLISFEVTSNNGTSSRYIGDFSLKTNNNVIHAEANALGKLAKSTFSGEGAEMYITLAPCLPCSHIIIASGIKRVYYKELYRDDSGIQNLINANIEVIKL